MNDSYIEPTKLCCGEVHSTDEAWEDEEGERYLFDDLSSKQKAQVIPKPTDR